MATITYQAQYSEIPLNQEAAAQEIRKLAIHLKVGKDVEVNFSREKEPHMSVELTTSAFTNGTARKMTGNVLQLFSSISSILNFSRKEKKVSFVMAKDWLLKPIIEGAREYYSLNDPDHSYFLYLLDDLSYVLCKINQTMNYYKELIGADYSKLTKCFRKLDDNLLERLDQEHLELLHLIAPIRDVDKNTQFMSQVAPLTGVLEDDSHDADSKLIRVRDDLISKGWINKIEGNYEVTEIYKNIKIFAVTDLLL